MSGRTDFDISSTRFQDPLRFRSRIVAAVRRTVAPLPWRALALACMIAVAGAACGSRGCGGCSSEPPVDAPAPDATGGLLLTLAAPPTTTNCQPTSAAGAGITGVSLTLERAAGGCAPVTFVRSAGGTYTVNCTTPVVTTCIERGDTLSVADLPPERYVLRVRGKIGAIDCWTTDATLDVAPGRPLRQTVNLARQAGC